MSLKMWARFCNLNQLLVMCKKSQIYDVMLVFLQSINIHQTHARSVYVLFPGRCEGISKTKLLNKSYLTIRSTINTLKQNMKSVQL